MLPVRSQPKADHPDPAPRLRRAWAEVLLGWFTHLIAVALFAVAWWCDKALTPGLQVALFLFVFAFPGVRRVGPALRLVCRTVGRVIVQAAAQAIVRAALPEGKAPMTKVQPGSTDS